MKNGQYFNKFNWKSFLNSSELTYGQKLTVRKIIKSIELGQRSGLRSLYGGGNRPAIVVPLKNKNGQNLSNQQILNAMKQRKLSQNKLNQAYIHVTGKNPPAAWWKTAGVSLLLASTVGVSGRTALGPRQQSTALVPVVRPTGALVPVVPPTGALVAAGTPRPATALNINLLRHMGHKVLA